MLFIKYRGSLHYEGKRANKEAKEHSAVLSNGDAMRTTRMTAQYLVPHKK